jgi:hypothetical protein
MKYDRHSLSASAHATSQHPRAKILHRHGTNSLRSKTTHASSQFSIFHFHPPRYFTRR